MYGAGRMALLVNTIYDIRTRVNQLQTSGHRSGGGGSNCVVANLGLVFSSWCSIVSDC